MRLDPAKLKEWRERRLLTQVELAAKAGRTEATINRLERGHHTATMRTIRQLAAALDVDPSELVMDTRTAPELSPERRRTSAPGSGEDGA